MIKLTSINSVKSTDGIDGYSGADVYRESGKQPFGDQDEFSYNELQPFVAWLRDNVLDGPVKISSAFRNFIPPGGSKNSAHLRGKAIDISMTSKELQRFRDGISNFLGASGGMVPIRGIGTYTWGVHLDVDDSLDFRAGNWLDDAGNAWDLRYWTVGVPAMLKPTSIPGLRPPTGQNIGHELEGKSYYILPILVLLLGMYLIRK